MPYNQEYEIRELVQKIERVLSYIENDSTTGRKGLFAQVEENREEIEKLKKTSLLRKGMAVGWGAAGSTIVILIKVIIDLVTK